VRFDDRLLTVLNQPAGDRHDVAVRWRQLVDLVARAGSNAASPTVVEALETIRNDAAQVDEKLRAAAARSVAYLPLPFGLLEFFASGELSVSAPVLAAATLDQGQWQSMLRVADEETRRFIETLHPELRAPESAELTEALVEPAPEEAPAAAAVSDTVDELVATADSIDDLVQRMSLLKEAVEQAPAIPQAKEVVHAAPSLHEVVQRIEGRRRNRSRKLGSPSSSAAAPALFRWECGPGGEIAWVDGAPRGALIGRSIARTQSGDGGSVAAGVVRAFTVRAPFRDGTLAVPGEGAVSGAWKISGVPAFDPSDGRFRGYRGIAMREQQAGVAEEDGSAPLSDPASVRELVHEVKTPLNAILGFAEIIEGQYLGPADRPYRDRAEDIVRQARLLLTAIDDVDFVAKVHSAAEGRAGRASLPSVFERVMPQLVAQADSRNVALDAPRVPRSAAAACEPELAERLVARLGSSLIDEADPGERMRFTIDRAGTRLRVSMTLPASLADRSEKHLLGDGPEWEQGFSLRLVRRLARMAGADMAASQGIVSILFPSA
jgi:signal transduction histidine kinase